MADEDSTDGRTKTTTIISTRIFRRTNKRRRREKRNGWRAAHCAGAGDCDRQRGAAGGAAATRRGIQRRLLSCTRKRHNIFLGLSMNVRKALFLESYCSWTVLTWRDSPCIKSIKSLALSQGVGTLCSVLFSFLYYLLV